MVAMMVAGGGYGSVRVARGRACMINLRPVSTAVHSVGKGSPRSKGWRWQNCPLSDEIDIGSAVRAHDFLASWRLGDCREGGGQLGDDLIEVDNVNCGGTTAGGIVCCGDQGGDRGERRKCWEGGFGGNFVNKG